MLPKRETFQKERHVHAKSEGTKHIILQMKRNWGSNDAVHQRRDVCLS